MRILITNLALESFGGTEVYVYAIAEVLIRRGYIVYYYTPHDGGIGFRLRELGVQRYSNQQVDLILCNHNTVSDFIGTAPIIQTCHGIIKEESPIKGIDKYVAISEEIQNMLRNIGISADIIRNGINLNRFTVRKPIRKALTNVLSNCKSYNGADGILREACKHIGVNLIIPETRIWNIEDIICECDLVVGIGRSLYDAMACGRCVISWDTRDYNGNLGDGYINSENINKSMEHNLTGRGSGHSFDVNMMIHELEKYNYHDGEFNRNFAENYLDINKSVDKYLDIYGAFLRQ